MLLRKAKAAQLREEKLGSTELKLRFKKISKMRGLLLSPTLGPFCWVAAYMNAEKVMRAMRYKVADCG